MTTHTSVFKQLLFSLIDEGIEYHLEAIYEYVAKHVEFDKDDLASTMLKGKPTGEPSWKRNVRNALQELKDAGQLVNSQHNRWRLPSAYNELVNIKQAWTLVKAEAIKSELEKTSWTSPIDEVVYSIDEVLDDRLIIIRESTGEKGPLTKAEIERGIQRFNVSGGRAGRRTLHYTVAKESSIVHLHPELIWNETREFIVHRKTESTPVTIQQVETFITEAKDDDINRLQKQARKIRQGQKKFRDNLIKLYHSKCCISATGPVNVLHAAHISSHALSGSNKSVNGLLLRADLHCLFDDNLIAIHPDDLTVYVHNELLSTHYKSFQGKQLQRRSDGLQPDSISLRVRWNSIPWAQEIEQLK